MLKQMYQNMISEIRMVLPYGIPSISTSKTIGQFLENEYSLLREDANDDVYCKVVGKETATRELKKFERCRSNIQHAAATLIQKGMWRAYLKNHSLIGPANLRQPNASSTFDNNDYSDYEYGNEYDLYNHEKDLYGDYMEQNEEMDNQYYYKIWLNEQEVDAYRDKQCNPYD